MSTFRSIKIAVFCTFLGLFIALTTACTKNKSADQKVKSEKSSPQTVRLAIWGNYISPKIIQYFEESKGIKVLVSHYTSNEELLAKIQAGARDIDVAVPSDYMVKILAALDYLEPINHQLIPNLKLVDEQFLNQEFDAKNKYSLPYAWATAGIAVHRDLYNKPIQGWADIINNPELKNKFSLLDDMREVAAVGLKISGFSVNSVSKTELDKAESILRQLKKFAKKMTSDTVDALVRKEVAVAHSYSTDALQAAQQTQGRVEFILPAEGGTRSIDNLVLFKSAKNKDAAHALINYMLSEDVNVEFVKTVWGGPVLKTTKERLPQEMQKNKALFPEKSTLEKFEALVDVGAETEKYESLWLKVKLN